MTELTITPKVEDKTARFKGTIAAGEHVAVTIKGGAEWIGEDDGANLTLRVIDIVTKRTLAVFPRPPEVMDEGAEPDAWGSSGDDLTCTLNLNSDRMVAAARHMLRVPVMFVLGDTDAPRTLYFRDQYEVEYWPERIGDDVPYDLDVWPKQIDEWMALVDEWTEQMSEFGETLSGHVENVGIHVTAAQKTAWTAKQDAIADLDAIRAGAARGATAIQEHQDISKKADLVGGKVPQSQLPSYVDDVLEYAAAANFPATGEEGKIYVAKDENKTYRWSGTQYVQIGGGGSDITVDSALSLTSTNPVQNKAVAGALASKLSRAEAEAGFTEWAVAGLVDGESVYSPPFLVPGSTRQWFLRIASSGGGIATYIALSDDGINATNLVFYGDRITATRTRLPTMADIRTKTSDLTNDGSDGEHPFISQDEVQHQQLTPVYSQTPTYGNDWTYEGLDEGFTVIQSPEFNEAVGPQPAHWDIEVFDGTQGYVREDYNSGETASTLHFGDMTATRVRTDIIGYTLGTQTTKPLQPKGDYLTEHQSLAGLMPMYSFETVTVGTGNTLTVAPYTGATYTADSNAAAFEIAVGALPTGVTGKARDAVLVIDCTSLMEGEEPTVTWDTHFHPRTDTATDFACVMGVRNVYYISEYAPGEFAVGGWVETEGGIGT